MSRFIFRDGHHLGFWVGSARGLIGKQSAGALPLRRGALRSPNHIGASGLIFGWLAFLIVFGFLPPAHCVADRRRRGRAVRCTGRRPYSAWLPGTPGVSWQGHFLWRGRRSVGGLSAVRARTQGAARHGRTKATNPYLTPLTAWRSQSNRDLRIPASADFTGRAGPIIDQLLAR